MHETGLHIDILSVWEKQRLTNPIQEQLGEIAEDVNERLNNPPQGITSNVSEWAKKELCWDKIKEQSIALNPDLKAILINHEQNRERVKEGFRNQAIQDSIHGQTHVVEKDASFWRNCANGIIPIEN